MAPAVGALILGEALASTVVFAGITLGQIVGSIVMQLAQTLISHLMAGKPSYGPSGGGYARPMSAEARDRTQIIRSSNQTMRMVYGEVMVSGVLNYAHCDSGSAPLHLSILMACREVQEIGEHYYNDKSADTITGKFIRTHLGADDQEADPDLVADTEFTDSHRLRGLAWTYNRLTWDIKQYPNGIPNIRALVKGHKLYDPRDGVTRWTRNPALALRDYLTYERGLGASSSEIDEASFIAAANVCEEQVTTGEQLTFTVGDAVQDLLELGDRCGWATGRRVYLRTTGSLPPGLSTGTAYYFVRAGVVNGTTCKLATSKDNAIAGIVINLSTNGSGTHTMAAAILVSSTDIATDQMTLDEQMTGMYTGDVVRVYSTGLPPTPLVNGTNYYLIRRTGKKFKLATSLANAYTGNAIELTGPGLGSVLTLERVSQLRYTCDGTVDLDKKPIDVIEDLLTACGGALAYREGSYFLFPASATSPSFSLSTSDLRGAPNLRARKARRELFNAVSGTYVDPDQYWQPTSFPQLTNASYEAQDGGQRINRDVDMPFTINTITAQRLAKIFLERSRQAIVLEFPAKLTALPISVWDVVTVSLPVFGFTDKQFRVVSWKLSEDGGVDLMLQEESAAAFDWSHGDESSVDTAPDTTLPVTDSVSPPGAPALSETLYESQTGAGLKTRVTAVIGASPDVFVVLYQLEYRLLSEGTFRQLPPSQSLTVVIDDVPAGVYVFRARAFNLLGIDSDYSPTTTFEVYRLALIPEDVTNFTLSPHNNSAHLRWDLHPASDVKIGGQFRIRWSPLLTGATWVNGVDLTPSGVAGSATEASLPLATGTYMIKAIDSSGNTSANATMIVTTVPDVVRLNNLITLTEHPDFLGERDSTAVIDDSLTLDSVIRIDDWPDVDSVVDFDLNGGDVDSFVDVDLVPNWDASAAISSSGTYNFHTIVDVGFVADVRATISVGSSLFNVSELFDTRPGNVDTWSSFDGALVEPLASVIVEMATTPDNPLGTPTWSSWTPFVAMDAHARGLKFRARLQTSDLSVNVRVDTLGVSVDAPDRVQDGTVVTSNSVDSTVTFSTPFVGAPTPGISIFGAATGDYVDYVSVTATQLVYSIRNSAGTRVARSTYWIAKGY